MMEKANAVEVVLFKLKAGTDREQFIHEAAVVQSKITQFKGFIKRQLLEGADGQWIDLVWWESLDDHYAASKLIMQDETVMPFMMAIDESNSTMLHLTPIALESVVS
jgi:hypothetical protein